MKSQFGLVRDGPSALFNRLFSEEPGRFSSRCDGLSANGTVHSAPHPVSHKFPQRCLGNNSSVRLIDDGAL